MGFALVKGLLRLPHDGYEAVTPFLNHLHNELPGHCEKLNAIKIIKEAGMSIKKQYLKSKPICKVTFRIPEQIGNGASDAYIVAEFNGWSTGAHPMKRLKNGAFTTTVDLKAGKEYQFRYLLDGASWIDEAEADKYVDTPFGDSRNSVVVV